MLSLSWPLALRAFQWERTEHHNMGVLQWYRCSVRQKCETCNVSLSRLSSNSRCLFGLILEQSLGGRQEVKLTGRLCVWNISP